MAVQIDCLALCRSSNKELAQYLRRLTSETTNASKVSAQLLEALKIEAIPPRVFAVWFKQCNDVQLLVKALHQEHSRGLRQLAIKRLGSVLRGPQFDDAWSALGQATGIVRLLAQLAVSDVKLLCKAIGKTAGSQIQRKQRQGCVTGLVKILASDHFSDAVAKNVDRRPLLNYYKHMVRATTDECCIAWMKNDALPKPDYSKLYMAHPDLYETKCLANIEAVDIVNRDVAFYYEYLHSLCILPSSHPRLSNSMQLAVTMLKQLRTRGNPSLTGHQFHDSLALPLVRRFWRKRTSSEQSIEAVEMIVEYFQKHQAAAGKLSLNEHSLFDYVLLMWNESPSAWEMILIELLKLIGPAATTLMQLPAVIKRVSSDHRSSLLTLLLLYLKPFRLDIRRDDELKRVQQQWPGQLFTALPRQQALVLLRRIQKAQGEVTPLEIAGFLPRRTFDLLLELSLSEDGKPKVERSREIIEELKEKSAKSREQPDRAFWARYAMACAIVSRSLSLYAEVLLWARRYNKDALTVMDIYSSDTLLSDECISLLSGVPSRKNPKPIDLTTVKNSVAEGNRICKMLLETACMGLPEPSFNGRTWFGVEWVFYRVLAHRLKHVDRLQDKLQLSHEVVYSIVWQDTLDTSLELEAVALEPKHEELQFNTVGGSERSSTFATCRPATLRFANELARGRDALWERYRPMVDPGVLSLSSFWPTGLAVQKLLRFKFEDGYGERGLPYIMARAQDVVFVDPGLAQMPYKSLTDIEKGSIGPFVDDWKWALKFWVEADCQGESRNRRIKQAWTHAFERLTNTDMTKEEAIQYWWEVFESAGVSTASLNIELPGSVELRLPEIDDPSDPTEWNPPSSSSPTDREFKARCLDCMMCPPFYTMRLPTDRFSAPIGPGVFTEGQRDPWEIYEDAKIAPQTVEALIALAVLYINCRQCPAERFLAKPFPNETYARYPALFLGDDFLEADKEWRTPLRATKNLERFQNEIPPTLLANLANAMYEKLCSGTGDGLERNIHKVIKALAHSDRPHSAIELINQVILDRPQDSSWHRQLLTRSVFNSLPAEQAKAFMVEFSKAIQQRMKLQESRSKRSEQAKSDAGLPAVKVTTVKMLAQLMRGAEFVDESFTVDLLASLFRHSTHPDMRAAIIESLVDLFVATRDNEVKSDILEALEKHAVPIASGLEEHKTLTEDEWLVAEQDLQLPEVSHGPLNSSTTPVLSVLLAALNRLNMSKKASEDCPAFIERVLLPILHSSTLTHERWTRIFVRKHMPDAMNVLMEQLPTVPVKVELLTTLVDSCAGYMPAGLVDTLAALLSTKLDPPTALADLNERLLKEKDLRESNAGSHWLSVWRHRGHLSPGAGDHLTKLLYNYQPREGISSDITLEKIQKILITQGQLILKRAEIDFYIWNQFVDHLKPGLLSPWQKHVRPVVERVCQIVTDLRSRTWEADVNRSPAVLPNIFKMQLWLLMNPATEDPVSRRALIVSGGLSMLRELANGKKPYHQQFDRLKTSMKQTTGEDRMFLAVEFGSAADNSNPQLFDYLCIELADELFAAVDSIHKSKDEESITAGVAMHLKWKQSPDEHIRMLGLKGCKSRLDANDKEKGYKWRDWSLFE